MEADKKIVRRNRRGMSAKDMYSWPDQDFEDMETVLAGELCDKPFKYMLAYN